jgi:antitoxin component HigA of HigAB toxin-antitoxin module
MENESFQTVTEYEAALREIERLFDAVPERPKLNNWKRYQGLSKHMKMSIFPCHNPV